VNDRSVLVVKIGGGLVRAEGREGLRRACAEAVTLAGRRRVLVVPGGGPFADAVRTVDALVGLADDVAHALALRAMDQLGEVLRPLLGGCPVTGELTAPRGLALVRAEPAFGERPEIPRSWAVTSDSLAVLAAAAIGAEEAILLKPVAGVAAGRSAAGPPLPGLTAAELQTLQARGGGRVVDGYLARAVRDSGVTVTVRTPGRLTGTRISAA
jgi:5-(aminomethyl)-3-furanmethanol phosphate kinase